MAEFNLNDIHSLEMVEMLEDNLPKTVSFISKELDVILAGLGIQPDLFSKIKERADGLKEVSGKGIIINTYVDPVTKETRREKFLITHGRVNGGVKLYGVTFWFPPNHPDYEKELDDARNFNKPVKVVYHDEPPGSGLLIIDVLQVGP